MARVQYSPIISSISGKAGNATFRSTASGGVVSGTKSYICPDPQDPPPKPPGLSQRRFKG